MRVILVILILVSLFLISCDPRTDEISEEPVREEDCDSYTSDHVIKRCKAVQALDMEMCDPITKYGFREDCILQIAELDQDESEFAFCELSKNKNHEIICRALVRKDVNVCFSMEENLAETSPLAMRDCIGLVARKMKDNSICDNFVTNSQQLLRVCGQTNSCRGEWIESASYHAEDCKGNVPNSS